ncbi:MAG: hypothetical protein LBD09_07145 [Treponema sp.]|jgi:hypothetical protein|nr:hypothetical protein [Treponema sp.]
MLISCKTPGGAAGDIPPDLSGPADQVSLDALALAKAQAEESRALAEYAGGEGYFPAEWSAAEDQYSAARGQTGDPETKEDAYARVTRWKGVKAAYDDIYNKSAPRFAGEQEKVLAAARDRAVQAGAEDILPEQLAQADALAAQAKQKVDGGDLAGGIGDGKAARDRYRVLETIALAHAKQAEADVNDFFSRDPDNYMLAAEAGNNAVDLYDSGDMARAQDAADEALARFNQVIKNGWLALVEEWAANAAAMRTAAQEARADVAVRQDFNAAEQVYNQAHAARRAEEFAAAGELFKQAADSFTTALARATAKRQQAEEALRQAEQKLAESEAKAQNVQDLIGGGEE